MSDKIKESTFWAYVRQGLKPWPELDLIRVENAIVPGTPDVNGTDFWVELKSVEGPREATKPVLVEHFTPEQRLWVGRRWRAGGRVYLLIRVSVGKVVTFVLLDGNVATDNLGKVNLAELRRQSVRSWVAHLDFEELAAILGRDELP